VILAGYDLERLGVAASAVRTRMEGSGAFKDIRSSIEGGHPEIQILFDQERASQLGLAGARHRGSCGIQRARRRGHALSPAGKENRRAGSQRRYACGFHRGSAQPGGQPRIGSPGDALRRSPKCASQRDRRKYAAPTRNGSR
jgi:hypothetical protein